MSSNSKKTKKRLAKQVD